PARGKLRVEKVAIGLNILSVKQRFVGPGEIEGIAKGFTYAPVLEFVATQIEDIALHSRWELVRNFSLDEAAVTEGGNVIADCPCLGAVLLSVVELSRLEGLEGDIGILVVIVAHHIPVILPSIYRQVCNTRV